eukprot:1159809-Pelagomonas_calceolata.AAC.8
MAAGEQPAACRTQPPLHANSEGAHRPVAHHAQRQQACPDHCSSASTNSNLSTHAIIPGQGLAGDPWAVCSTLCRAPAGPPPKLPAAAHAHHTAVAVGLVVLLHLERHI